MKTKKCDFSSFSDFAPDAPLMCTEERCAREELYQGPGGYLVDGLPPVPIFDATKLDAIKLLEA
eukprot:947813-Pyramimonas_sp.AAC.1